MRLTFFIQECPTCGRRLQVQVQYLGLKVACQHCQGSFVARDPAIPPLDVTEDSRDEVDRRVSSLLREGYVGR